ncbi:MarR family transcriptional regulator [Streptacidiphilus anmyonensis]|uniref:helix-turn-helix transcriptional regulator n=1 Tax=Streptacidiphilus anmyonensis TaxID=405782 RepID=UPI0005AA0BDE
MEQAPGDRATWTFLTNHARVLVQISRDPGVRVRDIALRCLLTERAVQRIITDLEQGGYLTHTRVGRTNHYQVTAAAPLRHPADAGPSVADLLALLSDHSGSDGHAHPGPGGHAHPGPDGHGAADPLGDGRPQRRA